MTLTKRTELRRIPDRGSRERKTINQILDAGFSSSCRILCRRPAIRHSYTVWPDGEKLYLRGSTASRMLRELETGIPACVTVTLVDGLVLARSAFDHSMNYRSVVAFGKARKIADAEQRIRSLRTISKHLIAGRWKEIREPSEKELTATMGLNS